MHAPLRVARFVAFAALSILGISMMLTTLDATLEKFHSAEENERERVRVRYAMDDAVDEAHASQYAGAERRGRVFGDVDAVRAAEAGVDGAPDLTRWHFVEIEPARVDAYTARLREYGATDISIEPKWELAAVDRAAVEGQADDTVNDDGPSCPINTPAYDARQGYRKSIGVDAAWNVPGGRGDGVGLADVEGEWNDKHEDLPSERIKHVAGRRQKQEGWRAHGTAVLGVVAAKNNGKGMLGIAPNVERIVTSSLGMIGAARALFEAAKALKPGDVLIVELHGPGPNYKGDGQRGFVPMEYWQPEYDAIQYATKKGIIVVEAGGNGDEDLDAPIYQGVFDRTKRDSGAIMVGAGAPSTGLKQPERSRMFFSNYGQRVDVQGWGWFVATLDYGDLQGCSTPSRKYTARFAGTSSASPVVAGAAAVVQGAYRAAHPGSVLSSLEMRALLTSTGTPQTGNNVEREHIGPLVHVARALQKLDVPLEN